MILLLLSINLFITHLPSKNHIYKIKSKMVKTISPTVHSRSIISVPSTKKSWPIGDIVNIRVNKKSAEYVTSQIVCQQTIQHPKLKSPKRGSVINIQRIRKKVTTNVNYANICLILKKKTQMIVLFSTLKNLVSQPKYLKNYEQPKQTMFTKRFAEL